MKKEIKPIQNIPTKPRVKFVKRAGAWCKTEWIDGKQTITWSSTKPK